MQIPEGRWSLAFPSERQFEGVLRVEHSESGLIRVSADIYLGGEHSAWWQSTAVTEEGAESEVVFSGRAYGRRDLAGTMTLDIGESSVSSGVISDNIFFDSTSVDLEHQTVEIRSIKIEVHRTVGQPAIPEVEHNGANWSLPQVLGAGGIACRVIDGVGELQEPSRVSDGDLDRILQDLAGDDPLQDAWHGHVVMCGKSLTRPSSFGVMFDYGGTPFNRLPRQGCAVFAEAIADKVPDTFVQRELLRTAAHEVGHMLNLIHPSEEGRVAGDTLMNQTAELQAVGDYPENINYEMLSDNREHVLHHPDPTVAFGKRPYRSRQCKHPRETDGGPPTRVSGNSLLSVNLERPAVAFAEPVYLTASLANLSNQPIQIVGDLDPSTSTFELIIENPAGRSTTIRPVARHCGGVAAEIPPGRSLRRDFPVFFDRDGALFRDPGSYTIQARFTGLGSRRREVCESAPVALRVLHPQGSQERVLEELEASPGASNFISLGGGAHLRTAVESVLGSHARGHVGGLRNLLLYYDALEFVRRRPEALDLVGEWRMDVMRRIQDIQVDPRRDRILHNNIAELRDAVNRVH